MKGERYIFKHSERFRFVLIFILLLLFSVKVCNAQTKLPKSNWGIRFGLNAISIKSYEAFKAGDILPNSSYTNKNGYLISTFARINKDRFFFQPELAWNEYNRVCSFSLPIDNSEGYYQPSDLSIKSKALNTNFIIGHNLINDYPFLFGVYGGTSFAGTYKSNYLLEHPDDSFPKTGLSLNLSGILGISINISKIYFDLRYEMCLPNNIDLKGKSDFPERYNEVKIKKTESILSFSFGVML